MVLFLSISKISSIEYHPSYDQKPNKCWSCCYLASTANFVSTDLGNLMSILLQVASKLKSVCYHLWIQNVISLSIVWKPGFKVSTRCTQVSCTYRFLRANAVSLMSIMGRGKSHETTNTISVLFLNGLFTYIPVTFEPIFSVIISNVDSKGLRREANSWLS